MVFYFNTYFPINVNLTNVDRTTSRKQTFNNQLKCFFSGDEKKGEKNCVIMNADFAYRTFRTVYGIPLYYSVLYI